MDFMSKVLAKSRKVRLSKNRQKKSWRKFSNVDDVEDFLEEQRQDARTGGPAYDKKDSDLFFIDLAPEPVAVKEPLPEPTNIPLWKELKCFRGISGSRGPETSKPHVNKALNVKSKALKRNVEIFVQRKTERRRHLDNKAEVRKTEPEPVKKRGNDPVFNRDLWGASSDKTDVEQRQAAIRKPVGLPPTLRLKKTSGFSAIEMPHPGMSYNPDETEHAKLIEIATSKAVKMAAMDARLAVFSKQRKLSNRTAADTWMEEMEEGLPNTGSTTVRDESTIKRESDDDSDDEIKGAVGKGRKTNKIRKREKLQEEKTKKRSELKKKRIRDNEVYSVKKIMKEIKTTEATNSRKNLARKAKMDDPKRIKKLGIVKYSEPDVDVKLREDIADNLRLLRPEGSLFLDRYKSLQRRNILEPRKLQKVKRKYKLKQYQIEGRKMEDE